MTSISLESKESSTNVVKTVCEFCGRVGHIESVFYKKHGVPSSYDGKNKGYNIKNGKTCTHCGRSDHTVDVCYRKLGFPTGYVFNNGNTTTISIVAVESKATDDQIQRYESQEVVNFSPEQYKALLALIRQPSSGNSAPTQSPVASISSCSTNTTSAPGTLLSFEKTNFTFWILDSRASDHVSSSLTNFHSYHRISPIMVKLPNGHHVHATYLGTVYLFASITLTNVLYIPSFTFNLISIS